MDDEDSYPRERPSGGGLSWAWSIAVALLIVSVVVSLFTPYKLFILFLPLGLAPIFFRRR